MFSESRGHCLTGPIAVRSSLPGQWLGITLHQLRPGSWGWTTAAAKDSPVTRRLGLTDLDRATAPALASTAVDLRITPGRQPDLGCARPPADRGD